MNSTRTINQTLKGARWLAGAALLGMLSSHSAFAQSVSIEVTTTKQQTFQGFGASIINPSAISCRAAGVPTVGSDWTLTSRYYAFRRLTRSVLPGSTSLLTKTSPNYTSALSQDDMYSAAFLLPGDSGKYCVVIANQSGKQYTVNLKVDALTTAASTGLIAFYTAPGSNDVNWLVQLTKGAITTTARPYSVLCYVQN